MVAAAMFNSPRQLIWLCNGSGLKYVSKQELQQKHTRREARGWQGDFYVMYAGGPLFTGQWNQQLRSTLRTVQQLVIFLLFFTVLPPFLFGTDRSNAKGIETPLMPPVTTIEHRLSGHLSPSITTAPCQPSSATQPPPNRKLAALSISYPQPKRWFSYEIRAPTAVRVSARTFVFMHEPL
ncbi:hypothetical protein Hdeb2414_s0025g00660871 [Helianthus debilis subsp. tardiflorus]